MLSFSPTIRIFVYTPPTDMRKQFNGLGVLVRQAMQQDVMTGDYFVFFNRRRNLCKILYWDRDGFSMWAKKLERGCFQIPGAQDGVTSITVDSTTLAMILGGVDLQSVQRRKRYRVASPTPSPTIDANSIDACATSCFQATA